MIRTLVKLNEKGLQPALPPNTHCLRILDAEVKRGTLHIIIETPEHSTKVGKQKGKK